MPAPISVTSKEVWPPEVHVPIQMQDQTLSDGRHEKIILFKNILIDRIYKSMRGPWTRQYVSFSSDAANPYVWVTRYRAEILDSATGGASQEFMCHTNMDLAGGAASARPPQRIRSELSISQGQKQVEFPRGYALRMESGPDVQADVNVMVLNNNDPHMNKALDFKVTIDYWDDTQARAHGLIPLMESAISINCPTETSPLNHGDTVCRPASKFLIQSAGDKRTGHWLVAPGRQIFKNELARGLGLKEDAAAQYIWMHVHPYAESIELIDKTTGASVWKGRVRNDPHQAVILSTDHYSSPKGILIHKDHEYELVATYNNRTSEDVDAMAALWMYFKDINAPK